MVGISSLLFSKGGILMEIRCPPSTLGNILGVKIVAKFFVANSMIKMFLPKFCKKKKSMEITKFLYMVEIGSKKKKKKKKF